MASTEGHKILIQEDCMFSEDIEIRNGDSHAILNNEGDRINNARDVTIGKHVWLGAHVRVMKGVKIADNCVVANSSVVTSSLNTNNSIYGGNPARLLKENIRWTRNRN